MIFLFSMMQQKDATYSYGTYLLISVNYSPSFKSLIKIGIIQYLKVESKPWFEKQTCKS